MLMFANDSKNKIKKELDMYDQITKDLWKYIQSSNQDKFENYISKDSYNIKKIILLE